MPATDETNVMDAPIEPTTYSQLKTWPSDARWELIDDVAYVMSGPQG